jgi:hypothetical protein
LFTCIALIGGAAAAGCNDSGESASLEEYFQELDEIDQRFDDDADAIGARGDELEEDDIDGATDLFQELVDLFERFVDELEDLDAPQAAEDAHDEAVENFKQAVDDFNESLDEARDADSVEAFLEAVFGAEESDAIEAATEACLDLERIAADNDITVDLDCEEEE